MKAWHYSRVRAGVRGARRFAAVATADVRAASARVSFVAGVSNRGGIRRDGGERVFFFFEQIQNANRTGQSQAIGSVTAHERHVTRSGPGRSWEQLRWADGAVARVTADASEKKSPS